MNKHKMTLHPFDDVLVTARERMKAGDHIHLQFNCAFCGEKQTFAEPDFLSETGKCEECGRITSLRTNGCNLLVVMSFG